MTIDVMLHKPGDDETQGEIHKAQRAGAYLMASIPCPHCGSNPLRMARFGQPYRTDRHEYVAVGCVECEEHVGTARMEMPTVFGAREDSAIFTGRARVYGVSR